MTDSMFGRLIRVPLRDGWKDEAGDFTPWLANEQNITLLGEAIGLELAVEAQEKSVGPFRADILCKDTATNQWVLIENQLERTDHSHLGQLITYAAGLQAVTIVWIAANFTEEHRAALDWLNESTGEGINFFGLEVELWRIGNSAVAPKFNVVSKPNDWTKSVTRRLGERNETEQRYFDFWSQLNERLQERNSSLRPPKPSGDNWKNFSVGRSEFSAVAVLSMHDKWIAAQLSIYGDDAKTYFHQLHRRRAEIEGRFGAQLQWEEMPNRKESRIRIQRTEVDPMDDGNWAELQDWLIERLEQFRDVFGPIVKTLDASERASQTA